MERAGSYPSLSHWHRRRENGIIEPERRPGDSRSVRCREPAQVLFPERIDDDAQTLPLRIAGDDAGNRGDILCEPARVDAAQQERGRGRTHRDLIGCARRHDLTVGKQGNLQTSLRLRYVMGG